MGTVVGSIAEPLVSGDAARSSSSDTSGDLFHSSFCFFLFFLGTFGVVRSFGCIVGLKTLRRRKPLGTIPKQKDRPWSDDAQSNIKNL
uniref:Transmembrane protein n=1 Tax=Romanomermis culicivorax TaxID=13658 RepID=A0A915IRH9_ROMCU